MKRSLIIAALLIILLPRPSWAVDCCWGTYGYQSSQISCELKTGTSCPFTKPNSSDCSKVQECSSFAPQTVCCVETFPGDTLKRTICTEQGTSVDCQKICTQDKDLCLKNMKPIPGDCALQDSCNKPAEAITPPPIKFEPIIPSFNVQIPGLTLPTSLQPTADGHYVFIPFLALYFTAIYKFSVGAAAVLAVIMIAIGGFIYLTAAGDPGKTGKAKTMIVNAVVGLFIAVGSYTVLSLINPDLLTFKSLRIEIVQRTEYDNAIYDKPPSKASGGLSSTTHDETFKAFASCYGIDWRILKSIAAAESGLNADSGAQDAATGVPEAKYLGLFQEDEAYCKSGITDPGAVAGCTGGRLNARLNTAAAATHLSSDLKKIVTACGNNLRQNLLILYAGHNNGGGVMNYLLDKHACTEEEQKKTVQQFYDEKGGSFRGVTSAKGVEKWTYGEKVVSNAAALGVTEAFPTGALQPSTCPPKYYQ
jgi:hypothetical protein